MATLNDNPIFAALGGTLPAEPFDIETAQIVVDIDGVQKFTGKLANPDKCTYESYYRVNPNGQAYGPCIALVGQSTPERALRALAQAMCHFSPPATGPAKGAVAQQVNRLKKAVVYINHK